MPNNLLYDFEKPATFDERFALPVDLNDQSAQQSTGVPLIDKMIGAGGQERYQFWPERLVRSAIDTPRQAISGELGTPGTREFSEQAIPGALDMASFAGGGLVGGTKGAAGAMGGKLIAVDHDPFVAPKFYSAVEQAVTNVSQPKMSGEQWLGTISNKPGVKPEELQYTGLKDYLAEKGKEPVSKQEIQNHLNENKVELGEVIKNDKVVESINDLAHPTKYSQYQLPGGDNYREVLLTLPKSKNSQRIDELQSQINQLYERKPRNSTNFATPEDETLFSQLTAERSKLIQQGENEYKSSHWDEPNVLVHMRMNDRMIDGKKSLHLEEIQSDWHQQGREHGYNISKKQYQIKLDELKKQHGELNDKIANAKTKEEYAELQSKQLALTDKFNELHDIKRNNIPDAPFKKSWTELALKNAVREAAEKGYDKLSWTPGEAQASRYDLSKQLNTVDYDPKNKVLIGYDKSDKRVIYEQGVEKEKLSDFVGKEAANKLLNTKLEDKAYIDPVHQLTGLDLKVGGEGMKGFYDQIVPKTLEKLTGEKVKSTNLVNYQVKEKNGKYNVYDDKGRFTNTFENKEEASMWINHLKENSNDKVHYIDIPQSLKTKALKQGFPLFSTSPVLVPVDHNPFENVK